MHPQVKALQIAQDIAADRETYGSTPSTSLELEVDTLSEMIPASHRAALRSAVRNFVQGKINQSQLHKAIYREIINMTPGDVTELFQPIDRTDLPDCDDHPLWQVKRRLINALGGDEGHDIGDAANLIEVMANNLGTHHEGFTDAQFIAALAGAIGHSDINLWRLKEVHASMKKWTQEQWRDDARAWSGWWDNPALADMANAERINKNTGGDK